MRTFSFLARRQSFGVPALLSLTLSLVACDRSTDTSKQGRPVEVAVAEASMHANVQRLTGEVQALKDVDIGFRIGGKVVERNVGVGGRVKAGQRLAKLDPETEQNALRAAKAGLDAVRGELQHARTDFERQEQLIRQGFTTRPRFDQALKAVEVGEARLNDAEAQVAQAQDRLGYTELLADSDGVVVSRRLEVGEVVQPGQAVFRIARDDSRDAVFDVSPRFLDQRPATGQFRITLASDPTVNAVGRVREVASAADPATGTFRVRVGLEHPPAAMQLGATIFGTLEKSSALVVSVPAGVLTSSGRDPAVWVVDPVTNRVALRRIEIMQFEPARIIVTQGLEAGELVVSAGVQALHPGQLVKVLRKSEKRARRDMKSASIG